MPNPEMMAKPRIPVEEPLKRRYPLVPDPTITPERFNPTPNPKPLEPVRTSPEPVPVGR